MGESHPKDWKDGALARCQGPPPLLGATSKLEKFLHELLSERFHDGITATKEANSACTIVLHPTLLILVERV